MMRDRVVRGLLPGPGLRAVFVRAGDTARMCRTLHGLAPTTAWVFAEALSAGLLLGALQKDAARVNLQLACDGPLRGLFVDATATGEVRGYARAPAVHFPGDPRRAARAALGGSGYLSVLRDLGKGQSQRSSVELQELVLARDLRRFFAESEQVDTALDLQIASREGEPLADVCGLLLQKLPGGDEGALGAARDRLAAGALAEVLAGERPTAQEAIRAAAGEGFELLADAEVSYVCGCSPERARASVSVLGREGVAAILEEERQAVVTCEFCRQTYVVGEADLREILERLSAA